MLPAPPPPPSFEAGQTAILCPQCAALLIVSGHVYAEVEYSPFYGIEKGAVLQEARMFNDRVVDARRCQQVSIATTHAIAELHRRRSNVRMTARALIEA